MLPGLSGADLEVLVLLCLLLHVPIDKLLLGACLFSALPVQVLVRICVQEFCVCYFARVRVRGLGLPLGHHVPAEDVVVHVALVLQYPLETD